MAEPKASPAPATVAEVLQDKILPLKELQAKVPSLAIASAWAAGDIEFGHQTYVITGPVGESNSAVVVETGMDWTGPKTGLHKTYKELVESNKPPECSKYCKADIPRIKVVDQASGAEYTEMGRISKQECHDLIAFQVRLTDKCLARLTAPVAA